MKKQYLTRTVILVALTLAAIGVIGYAANGGSPTPSNGLDAVAGLPDNDVMSSINRALGREPAAQAQPSLIAPQPALNDAASNERLAKSLEPGGSAPADSLTAGTDRKIVQTASLKLQVKEVGGSFEEVSRIATASGGFVASSNFSFIGEQQVAAMTIRVPAMRYQDVLREVRALGAKVDSEASNASDVTEEYSDLTARLRNLEATEGQLLQLLSQAHNISEVLQVQDRLNNVRGEIERVKGRMALLDKLTDLATITVHLRPVVASANAPDGGRLGEAVSDAWASSLDFLGSVTAGVLTVVVFSWWLFLALPAALVASRWLRSRSRAVQPVD